LKGVRYALLGYRWEDIVRELPPMRKIKEGSSIAEKFKMDRRSVLAMSLGWHVVGAAPIGPCPTDINLAVGGGCFRVIRETPVAKDETGQFSYRDFRSFVRKWLRKYLVPLQDDEVMTLLEWLDHTAYNQARKDQIVDDVGELTSKNIPTWGTYLWRRIVKVKSHIKREFYGAVKWARWINSRSDAYKGLTGPFFHAVESKLFKLWMFAKGLRTDQVIERISELDRAGSKFFATDHTSFESHIVAKLMKICEVQLYSYMAKGLSNSKVLNELFRALYDKQDMRMVNDSMKIKMRGEARMSGDMCTSLGNGFTNWMIMAYICHRKGWKTELQGIVEGDDGLFRADGPIPTTEDFEKMGFSIKIEVSDDIGEIGFCQRYFTKEKHSVINPTKVLITSGWTRSALKFAGQRILRQLSRAKAYSLLCEAPRNPVTSAMARWIIRSTSDVNPRFSMNDTDYYKYKTTFIKDNYVDYDYVGACYTLSLLGPTPAQRELVKRKFGMDIETQIGLEEYFEGLQGIQPIDTPLIQDILENTFIVNPCGGKDQLLSQYWHRWSWDNLVVNYHTFK